MMTVDCTRREWWARGDSGRVLNVHLMKPRDGGGRVLRYRDGTAGRVMVPPGVSFNPASFYTNMRADE